MFSGIEDFFYSWLWTFMSVILQIIDAIQNAFYYVVGVETLELKTASGATIEQSLMDSLFGTGKDEFGHYVINMDSPIHKAFYGMMGLFVILIVFCVICSVVKINMNRQDKESLPSTSKMIWKTVQAMGIVIIMPVLFTLLLAFIGLIFGYFTSILGATLVDRGDSAKIAQCLFEANIDPTTYLNLIEAEIPTFNMSYNELKSSVGWDNLKWPMLLLSEACVLVGMAMCTLTVAERLINIVLLYLVAPIVVATIPLDDGKRWESWKDITVAKVTTAGGNIISLYAYLYIISVFGYQIIGSGNSAEQNFVLSVVYLFITIGGAFVSAKGATIMSSIVSANAGQQEGMSFMASQAM